ncbi:matrix metalloproteinase-20 [Electrophorus electricus]|uniref:matrix metalloproteinase-20 n=1 Tax=Electrophorus electricus TaxID=8005 RepID=UPI0015D07C17|nr:matrix metalloproteinase-20 [Electrophorus electricus]
MQEKMKEMQHFFGIAQSGVLDPHTLAIMKTDRCGVPDVENFSLHPGQPKWKNQTITYRIAKYTTDLRMEQVEAALHLAFKLWNEATPLDFIRVNDSKADIIISFTTKAHGDFFPFDGPKGVLAHAFPPGEGVGGDVHIDDDEVWTMDYSQSGTAWKNDCQYDDHLDATTGYNLFTVAAHELGHSLGLSHSKDPDALMYPKYKTLHTAKYVLPRDDMLAIQALYGKNKRTQNRLLIPEKCHPGFSFDAVAVVGHEILFFKDSYLWLRKTRRLYQTRLEDGPVSTFLPSVNSPVDAAYDLPAQKAAYVFTGPKYWVVHRLRMASYYGSIYEYGFPVRVKHIDAAVHIREYSKTYFFTGDEYYRYDETAGEMDPGFPRQIQADWPGIMGRIDAAFALRVDQRSLPSVPGMDAFCTY